MHTFIGIGLVVLVEEDQVIPRLVDVDFIHHETKSAHLKDVLLVPLWQRNAAVVAEYRGRIAFVFDLQHPPWAAGRDHQRFVRRKVVQHMARGTDVVLPKPNVRGALQCRKV